MGLDPAHISCAKEFATLSGFPSLYPEVPRSRLLWPASIKKWQKKQEQNQTSASSKTRQWTDFICRNGTIHLTAYDASVSRSLQQITGSLRRRNSQRGNRISRHSLKNQNDPSYLKSSKRRALHKNLQLRSRPVFSRCFPNGFCALQSYFNLDSLNWFCTTISRTYPELWRQWSRSRLVMASVMIGTRLSHVRWHRSGRSAVKAIENRH